MRNYRILATIASIALALVLKAGAAQAQNQGQNPETLTFNLVPASDAIAPCLQDASATITVRLAEEIHGVDILQLGAQGLPPNTTFAVFLTELPVDPFGAVQYIGDFTTNEAGIGHVQVDAIIEEAFSSQLVNGTRIRKELNHLVFWFADPAADDFCFGPGGGPITPFDGDGEAGAAALSSKDSPGLP
jgi:hypothetical protein